MKKGIYTIHRTVIAALTLIGLAGCYESSRADFSFVDAHSDAHSDEATMDEDTGPGPECELWGVSVFVDYVQDLSPPAEGFVTVTLRAGQQLQLDVQNPLGELWAEILGSYQEEHEPIYLEVDDPGSMTIIDLIMPLESEVHDITPAADGMEVELVYSAAIHFLYLSYPCYEQMLAAIETAQRQGSSVLVCTDFNDGNKILDARPPLEP